MKQKNLSPCWYFFLSVLFIFGCTSQADNVAVTEDGVEIKFNQAGKGKPAIILIHGWANNKDIWNAQVSHFAKKYEVVAVDLASFGESGNNRSEWTMAAFAEDVTAVIEKLKLKKVVLVGFSLGGPVAIEAANKMPDLVSGIVIVDNLHDVDRKIQAAEASYSDSMGMDLVTNPSIEKLAIFFRNDVEESYQRILSMLGDGPRTGWEESLHGLTQWLNENSAEALGNLKAPVIAINSTMWETNVKAFRKYVPSFEVKLIPDAGHILMWDATEEFNRLLEESIQEFLKK